jgi:hypothetical protein
MNPATEQFALSIECVLCPCLRGNLIAIRAAEWTTPFWRPPRRVVVECFFYLCPEHDSCQGIEAFSVR